MDPTNDALFKIAQEEDPTLRPRPKWVVACRFNDQTELILPIQDDEQCEKVFRDVDDAFYQKSGCCIIKTAEDVPSLIVLDKLVCMTPMLYSYWKKIQEKDLL